MSEPVIEVRDLRADEVPAAVGVLARGMRDNPLHVAAYGTDPEWRLRCHGRLMRAVLTGSPAMEPISALRDATLVGVTGVAPPRTCQPTAGQRVRMLPTIATLGPRTATRVVRWVSTWAERDPDEPHVHLGPLAVDAHLQGQGIGSAIMREHCRRLDEAGDVGYLETDKRENVRFYERFGYEVLAEEPVIGVPNWFMRRAALATPPSKPAPPPRFATSAACQYHQAAAVCRSRTRKFGCYQGFEHGSRKGRNGSRGSRCGAGRLRL